MFKPKILAVDDNSDILDLIEATLEENYEITTASSGQEGLAKVKTVFPNLIILDFMLPDMDGPEICKRLRQDPLTLHTPVLMLTGKGELEDKVCGLESGVDDYMVKPFSPEELTARIKMLISRANINLDANPLTRLPGNVSITKKLEKIITTGEKFAVLYIDIDNFKALNDYYGFERGDTVIKDLGRIIINSIQEIGTSSDFIGHIGGDDFVIVTIPEKAELLAKRIIVEFDTAAPNFFNKEDRIKGTIETTDRSGKKRQFRFPTVSIGIITNLNREFGHIAEVSAEGAEVKKFAKKFDESKYIFNRRNTN